MMMRYVPVRNNAFDLFDDVFGVPSFSGQPLMKTDIHEKDGKYVMEMDLPGYKKEDIKVSLHNGNLTITAERNNSSEEKDDQGRILRQERYSGSCTRTFYVGTAIKDTDVHASFNDGTLTVEVPTEEKKEAEEKKFISIL